MSFSLALSVFLSLTQTHSQIAEPRHKYSTSCRTINKAKLWAWYIYFTQTDANDALATVTINNANYEKLNRAKRQKKNDNEPTKEKEWKYIAK